MSRRVWTREQIKIKPPPSDEKRLADLLESIRAYIGLHSTSSLVESKGNQ
jgi:hypothetical protein